MRMLTAILLAAVAPQRMKEFCVSKVEQEYWCFRPAACHPRYYSSLHKSKMLFVQFKSISMCDCLQVNRMHQLAFQQYTFRNYSTWPCHRAYQFLNPLPFFYDRYEKSSWKLCWIYIVDRINWLTRWRQFNRDCVQRISPYRGENILCCTV